MVPALVRRAVQEDRIVQAPELAEEGAQASRESGPTARSFGG